MPYLLTVYSSVSNIFLIPFFQSTGRHSHMCGIVGKNFVVAGGWNDGHLTSVELLDLDAPQKGWRRGPQLPYGLQHASTVQYENSLLIIGGWDGNYTRKSDILALDPAVPLKWRKLDQKMQMGRITHASVLVSSNEMNCQ